MSTEVPSAVDVEHLRSLRDAFKTAATDHPKLFHAMRVVIDAGRTPARPDEGWEEFLGISEVFAALAYERVGRSERHSCYYGAEGRLTEYTGLAAVARGVLTARFASMSNHRNHPRFDRDTWMLTLYRIATNLSGELPIDLHGSGRYARTEPWDYLRGVVTGDSAGKEHEAANLKKWQAEAKGCGGYTPRFVYATLPVDVFRASALAVEFLLRNASKIYGPKSRSVITRFPSFRRAEDGKVRVMLTPATDPTDAPTAADVAAASEDGRTNPATEGGEASTKPLRTRTDDERDEWIYSEAFKLVQYKEIVSRLKEKAKVTGWGRITTVQGVREAARRYAIRHDKSLPPSRQDK